MNKTAQNTGILSSTVNIYQFLGHLYKSEVTQELFSLIQEMTFPTEDEKDFVEGLKMMVKYSKQPPLDPLTELAVDYARLFLGAGMTESNSCAYPYESVYTSSEHLIMQNSRDQVLSIYNANDLKVAENFKMPEDHIAIELEFMAHLYKRPERLTTILSNSTTLFFLHKKKDFLLKHLLNWIPDFCIDIEKYADTIFYKGLAKVTYSFLHMDLNTINSNITQLSTRHIDMNMCKT